MPVTPRTLTVTRRGTDIHFESVWSFDEAVTLLSEHVLQGRVRSNFARSLCDQYAGRRSFADLGAHRRPLSSVQKRWVIYLLHEYEQRTPASPAPTVTTQPVTALEEVLAPANDNLARLEALQSERPRQRVWDELVRNSALEGPDVRDGGPLMRAFDAIVRTAANPQLRLYRNAASTEPDARVRLTQPRPTRSDLDLGRDDPMNSIEFRRGLRLADGLEILIGRRVWARVTQDGTVTVRPNIAAWLAERIELLTRTQRTFDTSARSMGRTSSRCCFCGHPLTDDRSINVGYGPTCATNWNLPWGERTRQQLDRTAERSATAIGLGAVIIDEASDLSFETRPAPVRTASRRHEARNTDCVCCSDPLGPFREEAVPVMDTFGYRICNDCEQEHLGLPPQE